jgi:NADH-ubiquinone oxidoreductase chain 4
MLVSSLLLIPLSGILLISNFSYFEKKDENLIYCKYIALIISVANLVLSFIIYILFNDSNNQFQFVQEHYNLQLFDIFLGIDGISIYFILLTTIIIPIALLSN